MGEQYTELIAFKATSSQKEALRHIAFARRKNISELIRDILLSDEAVAEKTLFFDQNVRHVEQNVADAEAARSADGID